MSDTETSAAESSAITREDRVAAELEAKLAQIRQQLDDVTALTIATITAPPMEPTVIAELPPPVAETVAAEPVAETSALPVETRRRFEAYGKSIASALSGFHGRLGGTRKLAS